MSPPPSPSIPPSTILDIGGSTLAKEIHSTLKHDFLMHGQKPGSKRSFPTELFYYGSGLELWGEVCWLPDYHQTRDEIALLEMYGGEIAEWVRPGCTVVDMGSGDIRKSATLLDHIDALGIPVNYYAVELSRTQLLSSMNYLSGRYKYVKPHGLWGTFEDARRWLSKIPTAKVILSLGSMFGNDEFDLAVARMGPWREVLGPSDLMLIGMDARGGNGTLRKMYHDPGRVWESFIRNGLETSNRLLGARWYKGEEWVVEGIIEDEPSRHRFALRAVKDVRCAALGLDIRRGEVVEFFESWKYGPRIMGRQFEEAGMVKHGVWRSPVGEFYDYLVSFKE